MMKDHILELLPKKYQKTFSKILKIFGKYFHFSDFENLIFFEKNEKSKKIQKIENFDNFQKPKSEK